MATFDPLDQRWAEGSGITTTSNGPVATPMPTTRPEFIYDSGLVLTAQQVNNALQVLGLGGSGSVPATYVQNTDSRVMSGNLQFSGANVTFGNSTVFSTINSTFYSQTSNNALNLGGVAAASFVLNTDSRVMSGNLEFSGANVVFDTLLTIGGQSGAAGNGVVSNTTTTRHGNATVFSTINATAFSQTANNALNLGGVAAASYLTAVPATYVQNTDSRILSGNLEFSGANVVFDTLITIGAQSGAAGNGVVSNTTTTRYGNSTVFSTVNSTVFSQTSNNALNLGGVAAASYLTSIPATYVQNTDSRTLSGNLVFSGANNFFSTMWTINAVPGAVANSVSANATTLLLGNSTVFSTVNSTIFSQTANNSNFLGGVGAANTNMATISYVIDGGGSTITTGIKGYIEVPFGCTINRATLLADQSGSIVVNIWKCTYANFAPGTHPVAADKITASAPPTITTATKAQDATLTGWTTTITAGDILAFNVDSVTTIQRATLSLKVTKT